MTISPRASDRTGPIHAVDLLRFAAALFVVAYHYGTGFARAPDARSATMLHGLATPLDLSHWTWSGWIGVEIFFVISGYVIAMSARDVGAATFVRRRLLRLLPATWICATATCVMLLICGADSPGNLIIAWLGSVGYSPFGDLIDASYWTLGIELGFYMMVASVLGARGSGRSLDRLAFVIGTISALFWIAAVAGWVGEVSRLMQLLLLQHGCLFALGMMIQALHDRGLTRACATMLLLLIVACSVETILHARFMAALLGLSMSVLVPLLVFLASVVFLISAKRLQPVLNALPFAGIFRTLGLMTFPLYLLHQDAGAAVLAVLLRLGSSTATATVITAGIVLATAWVIATRAEPWLRDRMRSLLSPRRDLAPDSPPIAFPSGG
jgi:peptidoglycan/LPS O-acetylase OafA/YrhL